MLPPIKRPDSAGLCSNLFTAAQGFVQINDTFVIFNTAFYETLILCTHYPFVVSGIVIAQDKVFTFPSLLPADPCAEPSVRTGSDQKRK